MVSGNTTFIAHLGYPTENFKAPLIYNPWFEHKGIDAVVMFMGVKTEADAFADTLAVLRRMTNTRGAPSLASRSCPSGPASRPRPISACCTWVLGPCPRAWP